MKELTITLTSLLIACAHSKTYIASIPCNRVKVKKANENLSYDWSYSLSISPLHKSDIKNRLSILSNGTLLINNFTNKDYGKYICHIKEGNSIIEDVSVDVNEKYIQRSVENCPSWACINTEKCGSPDLTRNCPNGNDVCCPMMKEKDKHRCQHFLGECMKFCHPNVLITRADDCPVGTMCCVLV